MKLKFGIKKYLLEFVLTLLFLIGLGWLIYISFRANRDPLFYEVISQVDVSSNYTSQLLLSRIILEPLIGSYFILGLKFSHWPLVFLILYPILRIGLILLDQYRYKHAICNHPISQMVEDSLKFTVFWGFLLFLLGLIVLGIGYFIEGFMFISNNFRWLLRVISWGNMSLFFGKTIYNIILKFKHKNLHFLNRFGIKLKRFKLNSKIQLNKPLKITKKEISILIEFFWITLMLTQALQYIHFPTHSIKTELASDEFLFDFHVHTTHSDGTLTPARRVDWYIDQGIQGAAFSDHHNLDAAIIAQKYIEKKNLDFTVLQAQEFTDDPENIHLNIYGNTDQVIIPTNYRGEGDSPEKLTCQEAIQWAKSEGFFVIVNHYKEPTRAPFTYEQLMEWGVDGFEVINGGDERAPEIRQFCLDNNLICIAGSDIHSNEDINTFVKLKLEDPTNKSIDAIFQALKHNEHEAVLVEYFPNDAQTSFQVLDDYINYFLGLSQTQIFSWLSWIILIYIAAIFTIKSMKGNKKVVEKII